MNWRSILGGDKVKAPPKPFTMPLKWFFAGLTLVFFLLDLKLHNIVLVWITALCFIGFAYFYVADKRGY